jgi:nitrogen-specific signal transduction histidine kinase
VQLKQELINDYRDLLPAISMDQARRIRGEQELIVRYEPERAIETLPSLLPERSDRDRLITLLDRLLADERVQNVKPLPEQLAMLERIRGLVSAEGAKQRRRVPTHEERRTLQ